MLLLSQGAKGGAVDSSTNRRFAHMSFQKTIIVGNVGRDPEMRYTPSGVPVTSFSVAVSRKWKNQSGEQQEKTTWFRVTCWRKTAELAAQYLQKGKLVLIEGDIDASAYTDREGTARASLELTATNLQFLGARGDTPEGAMAGGHPVAPGGDDFGGGGEDEIPF
jgi:single-strand DNA-binding protein